MGNKGDPDGMTKKLGNSHVLLSQSLFKEHRGWELGKWSGCLGPPHCGERSCASYTLQQPQVALGQGSQGVGILRPTQWEHP